MVTIVEKMATCEFYAHIYDEGTRVQLATSTTTKAFDDGHDAAVKELYAAVRAYLDKVKEYFDPEHSGIIFDSPPTIAFLTGFVFSGNKDCESFNALFSHHATPDSEYFGEGKNC